MAICDSHCYPGTDTYDLIAPQGEDKALIGAAALKKLP
jgi:hypothetical protein